MEEHSNHTSRVMVRRRWRRVVTKLSSCVDRIKPKFRPIVTSVSNSLCCLNQCLSSQDLCDTNKTKAKRKTEPADVTWCKLAYWEGKSRVGPHLPVSSSSVQIISSSSVSRSKTETINLDSMFSEASRPSEAILRTRDKIGQGLILSREETGVWVHNRSTVPIFVNSPTLDVPNSRTFSVFKIPPAYSMEIFNFELSRLYATLRDPAAYDGPFDPNSVRLSFAKGWGQNYARQYVECCPCWLEIMLLPSR